MERPRPSSDRRDLAASLVPPSQECAAGFSTRSCWRNPAPPKAVPPCRRRTPPIVEISAQAVPRLSENSIPLFRGSTYRQTRQTTVADLPAVEPRNGPRRRILPQTYAHLADL